MEQQGLRRFSVEVPAHEAVLNRTLAAYAEGHSLGLGTMMLCLRPDRVIRAWMKLKNSVRPLQDGAVRLGVDGQVLRIAVACGEVSVDACNEKADVQLSMTDAMQLVFSFNRYCAPEVDCVIPADWFPLPLYVPAPDHF